MSDIGTMFFTTKEKGSGIGLNLTKKILEQHGGSLNIESQQGKGTKVTIKLSKAEGS